MIDLTALGWFVLAGLVLNLTPGPDVLSVVSHALRAGWRAGALAALGVAAGCLVHIAAAALGVGALLATSATAFGVLKAVGAAYLAYAGWRLLRAGGSNATKFEAADATGTGESAVFHAKTVFLRGFWTNALNPKVALFFLAFVPQFIAPTVADKALAFILLGLLFNFNGLLVNLGWAAAAAWLARRAGGLQRSLRTLDSLAGALFIGFAIKLAFSRAPQAA